MSKKTNKKTNKNTSKRQSRGPSAGQPGRSARARLEQIRARELRTRRRRRLLIGAIAGVVVVAAAITTGLVIQRHNGQPADRVQASQDTAGRRISPPWPLPDDPANAAKTAGLRVARMEYTAAHFHTHLDITINGEPVPVPAGIGIDQADGQMSELHTHDQSGVLHVEAPSADHRYTLGQLFGEWRIRLDSQGIGNLNATSTSSLRAYVDGKRFTGSPATIELLPHRQIALIYGPRTAPDRPAASYQFQPNE